VVVGVAVNNVEESTEWIRRPYTNTWCLANRAGATSISRCLDLLQSALFIIRMLWVEMAQSDPALSKHSKYATSSLNFGLASEVRGYRSRLHRSAGCTVSRMPLYDRVINWPLPFSLPTSPSNFFLVPSTLYFFLPTFWIFRYYPSCQPEDGVAHSDRFAW